MSRALPLLVAIASFLAAHTAHAQPGRTDPGRPAPGAPGQPPPVVYGPGFTAAPPGLHLLTPEERELLVRGEIGQAEHVIGGLVSFFVPLGIGQAVQGRYRDTGWIFTVGELGSLTVMIIGAIKLTNASWDSDEDEDTGELLLATGVIGLVVFRVWEVIDAWVGPPRHNERVRAARLKAYSSPPPRYGMYLAPPKGGASGGVAGLTVRF